MSRPQHDLNKLIPAYNRVVLRWMRYAVELAVCYLVAAALGLDVWWGIVFIGIVGLIDGIVSGWGR